LEQLVTRTTTRRYQRGFTLIEAILVLSIILIVSAIALPSFVRMRRVYQLNGATSQTVDIVKRARFNAIRQDGLVDCRIIFAAGNTQIWSDTNRNGIAEATESQAFLNGAVNFVAAAGVPNTAGLATAVGGGGGGPAVVLNPVAPATGIAMTFDQRGAVAAPAGVNVFYLANTTTADPGYRAVIVLPSGSVQVWLTDSAGANWRLFD
jgi:prepilin-type N-terminal cleavage/methylation domain-containing protein